MEWLRIKLGYGARRMMTPEERKDRVNFAIGVFALIVISTLLFGGGAYVLIVNFVVDRNTSTPKILRNPSGPNKRFAPDACC